MDQLFRFVRTSSSDGEPFNNFDIWISEKPRCFALSNPSAVMESRDSLEIIFASFAILCKRERNLFTRDQDIVR